jgi:hypothetical protein
MRTFTQRKAARPGRTGGDRAAGETVNTAVQRDVGTRPGASPQQELQEALSQSPRVQTQLKLGQALNGGPRSVAQAKLAAEVVAQRQTTTEEELVAQRQPSEEEEVIAQRQTIDEEEEVAQKQTADEEELIAQRQTSEEEELVAQRQTSEDEEMLTTQAKRSSVAAPVQAQNGDAAAGAGVESKGGLPAGLRAGVEALSGVSVGDVRVEYNSPEPAKLGALATTQGRDIKLARGQERHLPHEAWHAAQQKQGRVQATTQMRRTPVNDDQSLEREADVMGARAARLTSGEGLAGGEATQRYALNRHGAAGGVAQRQTEEEGTVSVDVGAELEKAIGLIKKLAGEGEENEQKVELKGYVVELEEIAKGDDEELKAETLETLDSEARKQSRSSLAEVTDEASDLTDGAEAEPPVQGNFIWAFLTGLVSTHPYAALATTVTVVGLSLLKIKAEKSRRALPPRPTANLFTTNKTEYWVYFKRYIQDYCKANGVTNRDKRNLETATIAALNTAGNDAAIPGRFNVEAPKHVWDNANFLLPTYFNNNIYQPFDNGLGVVIGKDFGNANVIPTDLTGFAAALKKLPFVKALYAGTIQGKVSAPKKKKIHGGKSLLADWGDGGRLDSKVKLIDDGNYLTRARGDVDNGKLDKRVMEADRFIRRLVEPDILSGIPRPTIAVHLRNNQGFGSPFGLRAYTSGNEVHIAQNQSTDIIVHELGHYIEDRLPMDKWAEIHKLLQKRKGTATKGGYISPVGFNEKLSWDEQRYPGSYPGTGIYTSRYYTSGATEVTSRTAEYLSHPTRFKTLIETDPQQAALILRLLRPNEFAKERSLDQYVAKYLPH